MKTQKQTTMIKPLALAATTAIAASALFSTAHAENPFAGTELNSGYMQLAENKDAEGKCGEGKCGGDKKAKDGEGKCGEGKCGGDTKAKDGEGKCGEGKCGGKQGGYMKMMDADEDGKISKEEFIKAHEAKFDKMDANDDGVLEADEMKMHHKRGMKDGEGKCGEGKCGGDKKAKDGEGKCGEGKCGGTKS